jgi:hypothetical protein
MNGTKTLLDQLEIDLKNDATGELLTVYIDVFDSSLGRKWLSALNNLIEKNYHLEKNFCFHGFVESERNAEYITDQINQSIAAINQANLGYHINDHFTVANTIVPGEIGEFLEGGKLVHDKLNQLHRYFEDLQGVSGHMSGYYNQADDSTKWHIRQLNLLCHEYESLVLSMRKAVHAPEWRRPSQLMCWLNAPRFVLDADDFELFGIESLNRPAGGVFVGVNKAIGKHHYEVFRDEGGAGHRIDELTTSAMRSQTEAAGDFDIEWAISPGQYDWMKKELADFTQWLIDNGFDPDDKSLTIGHPQVGQVDLQRTFGSQDHNVIWSQLGLHLNVYKLRTSQASAIYEYNWSDSDYRDQQILQIKRGQIA